MQILACISTFFRKKEIDEILMNQIEQANANQSDGEKSKEESDKESESSASEQDSDSSYEKMPVSLYPS